MGQCKYERMRVFHCTRKVATATLSTVGKSNDKFVVLDARAKRIALPPILKRKRTGQ